jgi:hypothetical protein
VEAVLGAIAMILAVMALIWPTWIEGLSGLDPDGGSGETEWWLAAVFAGLALGLFLLARRSRRRAQLKTSPGSG